MSRSSSQVSPDFSVTPLDTIATSASVCLSDGFMPLVATGEVRRVLVCTCQHARWSGQYAAGRVAVLDVSKKLHQAANTAATGTIIQPPGTPHPDFEHLDSGRRTEHKFEVSDTLSAGSGSGTERCCFTIGNKPRNSRTVLRQTQEHVDMVPLSRDGQCAKIMVDTDNAGVVHCSTSCIPQ